MLGQISSVYVCLVQVSSGYIKVGRIRSGYFFLQVILNMFMLGQDRQVYIRLSPVKIF